ncbi:MAG: S8 family serine peptidase [Chloroflexia bacterium]|nr:S8 family serine peptidase [Chloroflexia bacterium]
MTAYPPKADFEPGEPEDPVDVINIVRLDGAKITESFTENLPNDAISSEKFEQKEAREPEGVTPGGKIHPVLAETLAKGPADSTEQILINFVDAIQIPRFPSLEIGEQRDAKRNKEVEAQSAALVRAIEERRAEGYAVLERELSDRYGATVLERFWLVNALLVEMPLAAVPQVADRDDVLYVEPRYAGELPPQDANANNDVDDGRARISSDPYFALGQTSGWIGLLDTGIRATHTLFASPSHIDFRRDCVNGGADCNTGTGLNPNDDCWNHGTCSAAIISGNGNLGDAYRGVTAITLDSFKVYPSTFDRTRCTGSLDRAAAVRGFQAAVAVLDRVIVAEMQGSGSDTSSISTAADNAFDAGAVIIAANGNNGPAASTVNEPANAHKVIGVGNYDVQSQNQIAGQSRGPAPDNRIKPDIQAPTNTETASNASDTALRIFGGTSGATPYAAGAAALLRNWLRGGNFSIDPGQVYAQLILSGQDPSPFDNTSGAGHLRLPTDGWAWWGKSVVLDIGPFEIRTINIPLDLNGERLNTLDAALWWPETASQAHNDIDLRLIDPGGTTRASSLSIPSVFERARVAGRVQPGRWTLQIRGYQVPSGVQVVYWAAHVRTS